MPDVPVRAERTAWQLVLVLWTGGLALAAMQAWAAVRSQSMNADGVSYLDIADAYARGDWAGAISSVWSPLYSWALVAAMVIGRGHGSEFVVVHLTNFVIFVLAFIGFSFLNRELVRHMRESANDDSRPLPNWAWQLVAHLLFVWAVLCLIAVWAVTPDMLMALFVCIAAGLIVRIRRGRAGAREFALLGIVLGLAYLAKAIMFPLGFLFLLGALLAAQDWRSTIPRLGVATALFLLISAPWIALISRHEGRPTFGEAGRLTYLRYVNGISYPHWQGEIPGLGRPVHPSRLLLQEPPVFAFDSAVGGTYPISYDPAYWYRGAEPRLDARQQANAMLRSGLIYYDLFAGALGGTLACALLLYTLAGRRRAGVREVMRRWALLLPAAGALLLYALVYVENRYVGIFLLLLSLELIANVRSRRSTPTRAIMLPSLLMIGFMAGNIVAFHLRGYAALTTNPVAVGSGVDVAAASPTEVAGSLQELGISEGDPVGVIGYAFDSFWARVARVRIVAELLGSQAGPLWEGGTEAERRVLSAFTAAGARAVVAEYVPTHAHLVGWQRVGRSRVYVRRLDEDASG